jgi:hypothetical protein
MNNKTTSVLIILIIYALTIFIGFTFYQLVDFQNVILKLLLTNLVMTFIIWLISLFLRNASLYDPYWSLVPPVLLMFVLIDQNLELNFSIYLLMFSISFWSIRLTHNWALNWQGFDHIDWRYLKIRDKAPKLYSAKPNASKQGKSSTGRWEYYTFRNLSDEQQKELKEVKNVK